MPRGTGVASGAHNGQHDYSWDYQNRLIGMADPVTGVSTNVYNGSGQRMETPNTDGTTMFVFDMQNLLIETDGTGTTQVYYTVGGTMPGQFGDAMSERFPQASTPYTEFYAFDALGSTDSLVDDTGTVDDHYVYTAFGTLVSSPQPTENRRTYVGKFGYQDDFGSGVYFCTARWTESDTARWLSQDPIWPKPGINPYEYIGNNPINKTDPSGLDEATIGKFNAIQFWTDFIKPWSKDPASDLMQFNQGCFGLAAIRLGVSPSNSYPPYDRGERQMLRHFFTGRRLC